MVVMARATKEKPFTRRNWTQNQIAPNWWNAKFGTEEYSVCARGGKFVPSSGGVFDKLERAMQACEFDARQKADKLIASAKLILSDLP